MKKRGPSFKKGIGKTLYVPAPLVEIVEQMIEEYKSGVKKDEKR